MKPTEAFEHSKRSTNYHLSPMLAESLTPIDGENVKNTIYRDAMYWTTTNIAEEIGIYSLPTTDDDYDDSSSTVAVDEGLELLKAEIKDERCYSEEEDDGKSAGTRTKNQRYNRIAVSPFKDMSANKYIRLESSRIDMSVCSSEGSCANPKTIDSHPMKAVQVAVLHLNAPANKFVDLSVCSSAESCPNHKIIHSHPKRDHNGNIKTSFLRTISRIFHNHSLYKDKGNTAQSSTSTLDVNLNTDNNSLPGSILSLNSLRSSRASIVSIISTQSSNRHHQARSSGSVKQRLLEDTDMSTAEFPSVAIRVCSPDEFDWKSSSLIRHTTEDEMYMLFFENTA